MSNSITTALRRLGKDAPELHARVVAGELSAHAAMVEAGLRPSTITVPIHDDDALYECLHRRLDLNRQWALTQRLIEFWGIAVVDSGNPVAANV